MADDPAVQAVLARVSPAKQQPNLVLATVSFLAGVQPTYGAFRAFILEHADEVTSVLQARRTQTNEVARCATLLPVLASLPDDRRAVQRMTMRPNRASMSRKAL